MSIRQPRYSHEEFARRGQEIYDRQVRPVLQPSDDCKFVAIDIESADYEMAADAYLASARLRSRHPDPQIWLMRVGQATAYRIGARFLHGDAK